MVLTSLALQLFLLFAGNIRRWRRVIGLRFLVWLAYLGSYAVAASAIGLFSQYEDKYKLRSLESSEDRHTLTLPFLWAPFLLLHLGGQDTITAFSIEDNDLWMRQVINLLVQLSLALYVFWKSFDLLNSKLLAIAVPLFIAGIIKYGERIRALERGSRDSLDCRTKMDDPTKPMEGPSHRPTIRQLSPPRDDDVASRALSSALCCRGLLVGRTLVQLGSGAAIKVLDAFAETEQTEAKVKFVLTELGMIYDMLYTKVTVLQKWKGSMFRCFALVAMMVAFVLFWVNQQLHAHKTTNAAITYALFVAAIFMEVYSIFMVIASPWTRARSNFLGWLSGKLACCFPSQRLSSPSMRQFNLTDYCLNKKSRPKFLSKVTGSLGLEKHWRNIWHVKDVEGDKGVIISYIAGLLNTDHNPYRERPQQLNLGWELKDLLTLPFEHALFRLHVFTEMYLSRLDGSGSGEMKVLAAVAVAVAVAVGGSVSDEMRKLAAECRKLSNYLMYLMVVYPSMLRVGSAAQDLESIFTEWVRGNHDNLEKAEILEKYTNAKFNANIRMRTPFKEPPSMGSLEEIKEVWARLLIYAAGKCPMELHARQLGNEVELLTVVGYLMMHHCLGDVGRELKLLAPLLGDTRERLVSVHENESMNMIPPEEPLYAFEFLRDYNEQMYVRAWGPLAKSRLRLTDQVCGHDL
ncbi:unnamed protein product [Triticum aestivum]|uniref:DUF4220 domain-containing protein n=4 Tax=Triticinae TaxID=1648030 RepID=A0A9R1JJB2_WHEAT|nr:hypothetical protein CFC21_032716 [Triticum aestivum]SPT20848.1 unnamed protein product [Triticum aestivum]